MSTHINDPQTVCDNSVGVGCGSCIASLFKPPRRAPDYTDHQCSVEARRDSQDDSLACQVRGSSRLLLLLTVVAFLLPLVVIVAVVQCLESHVGSVAAAIAGVAAALLTVVTSAGILKRCTGRSAVTGADR